MAHDKKTQSTGNYKSKRDKHEKPNPKGPGHAPKTSPGYVKSKYK